MQICYWKLFGFDSNNVYKEYLSNYGVSSVRIIRDYKAGYTPSEIKCAVEEGVETRAYRIGIYYKGKHLYNREFAEIFGVREAYVGRWRKTLSDAAIVAQLEAGITPPIPSSSSTGKCRQSGKLTINQKEFCRKYPSQENSVRRLLLKGRSMEHIEVFMRTGVALWTIPEPYVLNGDYATDSAVADYFKIDRGYVSRLRSTHGPDKALSILEGKYERDSRKSCVSFTVGGIRWRRTDLCNFLNVSRFVVMREKYIKSVLERFNYADRLKFPELAPYATWLFEDKWELVCPECGRRLLVTTGELQRFVHSEEFCKEAEICPNE